MNRRTFLRRLGAVGAVGLAGCVSQGTGGGDGDDGGDGETTETPSPSPTLTPTPSISSRSFDILGGESGTESNEATVSFGDPVVVEGTITGNNGCYTARLAEATYEDGTLDLLVEAYEDREDDQACTMALVEINYEARVSVAGGGPEQVVVRHDGTGEVTTVADEQR